MNKPGYGALAVVALLLAGCATAPRENLDYRRLNDNLDRLQQDPTLGQYATASRARAREYVERLKTASDDQSSRLSYVAERRVDEAYADAQLEDAQHKLDLLQREHDKILLQASQRDAKMARRELERQRLQSLAAAEEAQRYQQQGQQYSQAAEQARQEAAQAQALAKAQAHETDLARKEAHLAEAAAQAMRSQLDNLHATRGAEGMQMTLGDVAFAPGQSALRPEAKAHLDKLVDFVRSQPGKRIRIEGYTDSSGSSAANQALSRRRADAVEAALVGAGIDASRIQTAGMGEAQPVASNATAQGRAQNRRVVVILRDSGS